MTAYRLFYKPSASLSGTTLLICCIRLQYKYFPHRCPFRSMLCSQSKRFITNFTFTLPCIVIDFLLNNQPDALIIHIYSVKELYMFRASSLPIKWYETYQCRMYSRKLLMMDREDARNM